MGELAFKPRRDARMPGSDFRCPSGRRTGGPRVVTAWPCGKCTGIRTECRDAGSRVCEVHYSHHASGTDRRSDVVRRLTRMMIQTDVTCDSSPLRAARENRSKPSRCQKGLCRTELPAQCSRRSALAVIALSWDMQSESAIAGARRMKASWGAPYASIAKCARGLQRGLDRVQASLLARCSMRAYRPDPVPPCMAETLVAAAQSGLIMLQPRKDGSMTHFGVPFRGARAAILANTNVKARVRSASPRHLQRERNAARLADLDRWRR